MTEMGVGDEADFVEQFQSSVDRGQVDRRPTSASLDKHLIRGSVPKFGYDRQHENALRGRAITASPQLVCPLLGHLGA